MFEIFKYVSNIQICFKYSNMIQIGIFKYDSNIQIIKYVSNIQICFKYSNMLDI